MATPHAHHKPRCYYCRSRKYTRLRPAVSGEPVPTCLKCEPVPDEAIDQIAALHAAQRKVDAECAAWFEERAALVRRTESILANGDLVGLSDEARGHLERHLVELNRIGGGADHTCPVPFITWPTSEEREPASPHSPEARMFQLDGLRARGLPMEISERMVGWSPGAARQARRRGLRQLSKRDMAKRRP